MKAMRKCKDCGVYTLLDKCPSCGKPSQSPHPPKYSPHDKYAKYRRMQ